MNLTPSDPPAPPLQSCGFIIFRQGPGGWQFLLLRHADRWDLPKGMREDGETDVQCALRELHEETGITASQIVQHPDFQFVKQYQVLGSDGRKWPKQLTIFLGVLQNQVTIQVTEHLGYRWFDWNPPQQIEAKNVDQVLTAVHERGLPAPPAS